FAPRTRGGGEWTVEDDGRDVFVVSPSLGDLGPGEECVIHLALLALPADDTRATRAIQAARRTVLGDGTGRLIPPPVSVTMRDDPGKEMRYGETPGAAPDGTPAIDAFWLTPGKLDEILLGGSPNPFRDATTIEYEVPGRTVDEDGVEHVLSGAAVPTSVKVYNVTGRLIATLVESPHGPGRYRTGWTAQNDDGGAVASGVYYVKLTIGKRSVTTRLVQLK
ncbi:MAG TPA: T9SS type A sorting domain-containing protein, partial [Candidatus Krumholzibacteria bacterium]|nr:T9SS type A sorting domain-containing protein [Candidatus Krumholzibacteria bacterium]